MPDRSARQGRSLRDALRAENWWGSKLPPLFGLAFVQILLLDIDPHRALGLLFCVLVVTGGSVGAYGHVLNDTFDVAADRRIGKKNMMAPFPPVLRYLICAFFVVLAFVPALFIDYGRFALFLLALEVMLPALYSIPPIRLKDRGILGVFADAAGAHVVPALIVMTAFAGTDDRAGNAVLLVLVTVWTTCLGLKGILWHQGLDRDDDIMAGAGTFAAAADPSTLDTILGRVVYPIEVASFVGIVAVVFPEAWLLSVFLLASVIADLVKTALGWNYVFDSSRPSLNRPYLPLTSNFFYELWFPLALAVQLSLKNFVFSPVLLIFVVVFFRNVREQFIDVRSVITAVRHRWARHSQWRKWGWHLDLHGGARAHLEKGLEGGVRVVVDEPGALAWHIKLYRDRIQVVQGHVYAVNFEIRADEDRRLTYCVAGGSEPWDSLGLSEEIRVGTAWSGRIDRFEAAFSDHDAHASFLLGGSSPSVELRNIGFPEPTTGHNEHHRRMR